MVIITPLVVIIAKIVIIIFVLVMLIWRTGQGGDASGNCIFLLNVIIILVIIIRLVIIISLVVIITIIMLSAMMTNPIIGFTYLLVYKQIPRRLMTL